MILKQLWAHLLVLVEHNPLVMATTQPTNVLHRSTRWVALREEITRLHTCPILCVLADAVLYKLIA
jgi:hypothetical protein